MVCENQLLHLTQNSPSHLLPINRPQKVPHRLTIQSALITARELPPNAYHRKLNSSWRGAFSLGVDWGLSRTGVALSKGFSFLPLTILELRGDKLEAKLLQIAREKEADEFIIGLPKSSNGAETVQSNKVRSVAGRLASRAAELGLRVYLQDEHGTSLEAAYRMIDMGLKKSERQMKNDAFAAVILLERYYFLGGEGVELVVPKQMELQKKLLQGSIKEFDLDFD